ncbi:hypothetical protein [Bradyrhizobium sp. LMTR 3]|uniref:hypothetical protein n=1 Tax=Bradyrhizobium sp. LMTR 3 TaxID=189873 RepID=UPI00159F2DE5|nr:hypothetical protein [Bradyrhizobium sp. LMTR 3]
MSTGLRPIARPADGAVTADAAAECTDAEHHADSPALKSRSFVRCSRKTAEYAWYSKDEGASGQHRIGVREHSG